MKEEITLCENGDDSSVTSIHLFDGYYYNMRRKLGIGNNEARMSVYIKDKKLQKTLEDAGLSLIDTGKSKELQVFIGFDNRSSSKITLHTVYNNSPFEVTDMATLSTIADQIEGCFLINTLKIAVYSWTNPCNDTLKTIAYLTELDIRNIHLELLEEFKQLEEKRRTDNDRRN